jgi:excisionase family DNA binding protein
MAASHAHLVKFSTKDIDPQGFIKISRAAKLLDVSHQTIRTWCAQGKLRAYDVLGNKRIKANEFLRFVDIYAK